MSWARRKPTTWPRTPGLIRSREDERNGRGVSRHEPPGITAGRIRRFELHHDLSDFRVCLDTTPKHSPPCPMVLQARSHLEKYLQRWCDSMRSCNCYKAWSPNSCPMGKHCSYFRWSPLAATPIQWVSVSPGFSPKDRMHETSPSASDRTPPLRTKRPFLADDWPLTK